MRVHPWRCIPNEITSCKRTEERYLTQAIRKEALEASKQVAKREAVEQDGIPIVPHFCTQVLPIDVELEPSRYENPDNFMSRLTEAGTSAGTPGADCALSSDIVTSGRPLGRRW
jgi:hypothetical protein